MNLDTFLIFTAQTPPSLHGSLSPSRAGSDGVSPKTGISLLACDLEQMRASGEGQVMVDIASMSTAVTSFSTEMTSLLHLM